MLAANPTTTDTWRWALLDRIVLVAYCNDLLELLHSSRGTKEASSPGGQSNILLNCKHATNSIPAKAGTTDFCPQKTLVAQFLGCCRVL
jgi:hypothetical protein